MFNIIDKAVEILNPRKAVMRKYARKILAASGHTGASVTRKSMTAWDVSSGDSDSDDIADRSRDLFRNNPHGRGAIKTNVTNVIGTGLKLQSRINRSFLKLSDMQANDWQNNTEREFK